MPVTAYPKSYEQLKLNSYFMACSDSAAYGVKLGVLMNDFLLKLHGVKLSEQIRTIEANGVKITRRFYCDVRAGTRQGGSLKWLAYFHQFWVDKGYTFKVVDMLSADFKANFFSYYQIGLPLRYDSPDQVTPGLM